MWSLRVRSSILVKRDGKEVLADVVIIGHSDRAAFFERMGPRQTRLAEVALEDEDFSPLFQRVARLDKCPRGVSPASTMIVACVSADIVMFRSGKKKLFAVGFFCALYRFTGT